MMGRRFNLSTLALAAAQALLIALPFAAKALDDSFLLAFAARVLVYAIAASALNIALGLGGMVSLGHALFLGLGMYSVALPAHFGIDSGWVHLAIAVASCAAVGSLTGGISLRITGMGFIMITLAFAQMGYFAVVSLKQFGGDDGLAVAASSRFFGWGIGSPTAVYAGALVLLVLLLLWTARLRHAPFGMALRAGRQSPRRVASLGIALQRVQLQAYVASAVFTGLAGMLLANLNSYASPSTMSWLISGELIVMVVVGGVGSVLGPAIGALLFLGAEELLKAATEHWMAVFGLVIVGVAMVGRSGVAGWLRRKSKSRAHEAPTAAPIIAPASKTGTA